APRAVLLDVKNEKVSREAARSEYGVVIRPDTFKVDEAATAALREQLRRQKQAEGGRPKTET
ncbi:MAG: hypothetical protein HYU36_18825, partial [Planctomycetes bacterium]|nr:hypothetical protein [Planctomycetota bacterium]